MFKALDEFFKVIARPQEIESEEEQEVEEEIYVIEEEESEEEREEEIDSEEEEIKTTGIKRKNYKHEKKKKKTSNKKFKRYTTERISENIIVNEERKRKVLKDAKLLKNNKGIEVYQYNSQPLNSIEAVDAKVILVVGQTGSGKTTMINSWMNYLLNVQFEDPFRYILINEEVEDGEKKINQAHSQTTSVNRYYIRSHNGHPPIVIIDTPGFGDTKGPMEDLSITSKIADLFENHIEKIDVIAFVIPSTSVRLTASQKYVFSKVLELFGNDMASNIIAMLTFADGEEPQAVDACDEFNIPRKAMLKFNNSAIFSAKRDHFTRLFWEMGMCGFEELSKLLPLIHSRSLKLTNEVLRNRKRLENIIMEIRPQINNGLARLDSMCRVMNELKARKEEMDASKHFQIEYNEPQVKKVDLAVGFHTTTCLVCNRTCHQKCRIPDDGKKFDCRAIDDDGNCVVCPGKCKWDQHKNTPYYLELVMVKKFQKSEDLYKRYVSAQSGKDKSQQILEGIVSEFVTVQREVADLIRQLYQCLKKLQAIALVPRPFGVCDYIDILISTETSEKKVGWKDRLKALREIKNNNTFLKAIEDNDYNPFQEQQKQVAEMLNDLNLTTTLKSNFLRNLFS